MSQFDENLIVLWKDAKELYELVEHPSPENLEWWDSLRKTVERIARLYIRICWRCPKCGSADRNE